MNEIEAINSMVGQTIKSVSGLNKGSDEVVINCESGLFFRFLHHQDCCESVDLYDYEGDESDIVGGLVTAAEEVSSEDEPESPFEYSESHTWTFYKIETSKGGLWMRWLGESNGYYSESVDVEVGHAQ